MVKENLSECMNKKTPQTLTEQPPPCFRLQNKLMGHKSRLTYFTWSQDGKRIASSSEDNTVRIWDTDSGRCLNILEKHTGTVWSVAWSPNSKEIASASNDGTILIWDVKSGELKRKLFVNGYNDKAYCLSWSPDGRLIASGHSSGKIRLWDKGSIKPKKTIEDHTSYVFSLAWSPDSKWLASGSSGGTVGLVDPLEGKVHLKFCDTSRRIFSSKFYTCWSADGRTIASASADGIIRLWDSDSGRLLRVLQGHSARVHCVSFSSDGLLFGSISEDDTVRLWMCDTWQTIAILDVSNHSVELSGGLAFHPKKQVIATMNNADMAIYLWKIDLDVILNKRLVAHSINYTNAKVVLVGDSGTGKTCLARALMGKPFKPQESTHGMKIWHLHTETIRQKNGEDIIHEIILWDLAGQVDYQVVHQLFLDETVLCILLFDPTHPENPFGGVGHWDKAISRIAGQDCAKLLLAARVDRGHATVTEDDIASFCREHGYRQYISTSAKTNKGVEETSKAIRETIPWDKLPVTSSPELWKQIREYLLKRRSGRYVLTTVKNLHTAFRRQHDGVHFTEADFNTVILHAQAQGLL